MIKMARPFALALLSIVLLSISVSGTSLSAASGEDPLLLGFVVVRPASGASYMADRQSFASMQPLDSIAEVRAFVERYEAAENDLLSVRHYLEDRGITVIAASSPLLAISGPQSMLQEILPLAGLSAYLSDPETRSRAWTVKLDPQAFRGDPLLGLLDGAIIYSSLTDEPLPAPSISGMPLRDTQVVEACSPPDCYTVYDVAELLRAERVQETMGKRGAGVRIGFIDEGLLSTHPFFADSPLEHESYAFQDGDIVRVSSNFDKWSHGGHGTMVAAFLHAFAPDARLVSFAMRPSEEADDILVALYLAEMYDRGLVDVLSLSIAWWEEDPRWDDTGVGPEITTEILFLIDDGVIVLAGAGNRGQSYPNHYGTFDSGHSALAAIPQVIAVGGADTDLSAAGGYEKPVTGAASFESDDHSGRFVPDVVGIYGPSIYHPYPWIWNLYRGYLTDTCGTSGATPQIAGIVALLKEQHPSLDQFQVREILEQSAWDIDHGESGDGDVADFGYDRATGYGLPLATWVLDSQVHLYRGWNLMGLIKEHSSPYSAVELLTEINDAAGYTCDQVSYWDRATSKYQGVTVKENGAVYGFDFDLNLTTGYWVHCLAGVMWRPSGTAYVDTPQPLHVGLGLNFVSVPYTEGYCTASDLLAGFQGECSRLVRYDGQMQEKQEGGLAGGYDFPLSPGQGYILQCDGTADWTPSCGSARESAVSTPVLPANVYPSEVEPKLALAAEIAERREAPIAALDTSCKPQGVRFTNVSDQQVTVSWTTQDPCMGSVVLHTGSDPVFQAFDDRGLRFNGTTHHVTIRGLVPDTIYSLGLLSGDYWDDRGGLFYQASTGDGLSKQLVGQFNASGAVTDASAAAAQDAVVYFKLQNRNETPVIESAILSFPVYQSVSAFAVTLDNARAQDGATSFAYTSATHLHAQAQGGSVGTAFNVVPINLGSTPSVELNDLAFSATPPDKPILHSPTGGVISRHPTFRFTTGGSAGQTLTYRLEISTDNFASVERVYDQRTDTTGWSSATYEPGEQASFTIPEAIDKMIAYQWRVVATNGENWSGTSDISTLSYAALADIYLPLVCRGATGGTAPGSTVTPQPSSTPFPTATGTPVIPTPSGPTFTPTSTFTPTPTRTPTSTPIPPYETVCDNLDSCFSSYQCCGAWGHVGPDTGHNEYTYNLHAYWTLNIQNSAMDWGKWMPSLTYAGTYEVYIWYPHYPGIYPETNSAHYQVHHSGGDTFITRDQATGYGGWQLLATVQCPAGTGCYVKLTDETHETNYTRRVWFDAVRFKRIGN